MTFGYEMLNVDADSGGYLHYPSSALLMSAALVLGKWFDL